MKLGLYGGTFSPPHMGHVRAAETFLREYALDRLYIMPASIPPHKQIDALDDPRHRFNMAKLAFEPLCRGGRCEVSALELERAGKSYTSDTLRELYAINGLCGRQAVYMLCGTDMFETMHQWHEPDVIFSLAHIVVARRERDDADMIAEQRSRVMRDFGAAVDVLHLTPLEISSTEVRDMLSRGGDPDSMILPEAVEDYIRRMGLYGTSGTE